MKKKLLQNKSPFFAFAKEKQRKTNSFSLMLCLVTFFAFSFTHLSFAQTITIPAANNSSGNVNDPFGTFWGFERTALIYTSAEIGTTGTINQVGFYLNSVSTPGAATNVRIYMKMRTTLMNAASAYATETTGATLVYGPTTIASGTFVAGWVTIPLATTFAYTGGTNNLEVIIETNATVTGNEGSTAKLFRYSTALDNQYYQNWYADNTAPPGNGTLSDSRPNIQLNFVSAVPTITNLGSASGCVGSSLIITGTNFTGASAVAIGGTAATSYVVNSATQITAVVGSGTTGTVAVTTAGGTATSAATFTVNPIPVITNQPVATSVCTTGTTTFSVTATGATSYQWRRNGINLTNVAPYSNVGTATLTITNPAVGDAGNFDVIVGTAAPCTVTSSPADALTVTTVPSASITPSPANAAIGICYAGTGAITSISWASTATATTYDVFFGAGSLPGSVTSNVAVTSYTTGALLANTTYHWKVVAKNTCGDAVGSSTWTFTTASAICYCASTYTSGPGTIDQIANVTLGTLNNSTGASGNPYYTFYNAVTVPDLQRSVTAAVSVTLGSDSNQYVGVWIDFNQDGVFQTTEGVVSGNAGSSGTVVINIPVPAGATLGNTRMRVRGGNDSVLTTSQACGASSSGFGETEDYIVNIIALAPPTITSLGSASGCAGSSITINGTNFTGAIAADVNIGGTAVTSITSNSGTVIVAIIGTGTTGTVAVTTAGGTATSAATFTVNPVPVITVQPVAPASVCAGTGTRTISITATGATTYQWRRAGTNIADNATYSGTNTATLTITNPAAGIAGNFDVVVGNAVPCTVTSNTVAVAVASAPVITTPPANSTIITGANTSFTIVASNTPTGYTWEVSTNGGGIWNTVTNGGVYTNATTATLNITAATIGMNSYMYRCNATNTCGTTTSASATLIVTTSYCTSTGGNLSEGITGVVFNTISNTGTAVNVAYSNYTAITTTVTKGNSYNLNVHINTGGNYTDYQSVWIDWNGNGLFTDPGEFYNLGTAKNVTNGLSSLCPYPIPVPLAAITGAVRMRIQSKYNATTTGSCETAFNGEVEDYTINIISDPAACATPTAQATALVLSPNGTSVSGSFTAASPVPNRYLVIISTSAVAPAPVNGTVYTVGGTVGAGYTVVDTDSNTTFLANGLTSNTNYHVYVFAFNGICSGGPLYNTTAPLNGSTTTLNNIYCTPSSVRSGDYISGIASVGTLNDISNAPTGYSPNGYANYTGITIASQIPAGGINIDIHLTGSQFIRAYVDWNNDGNFIDAGEEVYTTGTTATGDTSFGFIVPGAQAPGNYRMRIRTKSFNENSTIDPCTTGFLTGEAEDYTINIQADCLQKITSWTDGEACGPTNTVNLTAVSAGATGFRWYAAETGGTAIQDVAGSGNWTTPSIGSTTIYYVTAYNGTCESLYRVPVVATIKTTTNIMVTPSVPSVCGEGNVVEISANGDVVVEDVLVQNFESGLGSFTITIPTNTLGGTDSPWSIKTSPYQPTTTSVWRPAINSAAAATIGNKFAFTTSDYNNSNIETRLTTPVINASIYTSLTLTFDHYYSYYGGDSGSIEVSIDGGTTWITPALAVYNSDLGSASKFTNATVDFSAYAGQSNLQFRFTYKGSWDDGWAVDNINLVGTRPLNTTFTWSGGVDAFTDAACTIPYVAQLVTTIYVKPTGAQINAATWSFTASTTLGNGCPVSKFITITNNTKTWQGTSTNWNDANNWMPVGVPDINTCVIIPSSVNQSVLSTGLAGNGKNLIVKSGGILELQSGNSLTIKEGVAINIGGTFNIQNNSSLVQIDNVANTGNISMKRDANIRKLDYVYWSSPVANFASSAISTGTSTGYIYKWLPTTVTAYGVFGNWAGGSETMITGKGYIVRGPNSFTATPQIFTANFTGVPNNGNITTPIARGTYFGVPYAGPTSTLVTEDDDNWNLIGNPYPSAIDALSFLSANTNVAGFVKIWSHGTIPLSGISDPFYQDYIYNYSLTDYITYNNLGASSSPLFTGKIGAGQGFFVLMNHSSISPNENAVFDNSMRDHTYRNDQFFRTNEAASPSITERNRIWLDLIAPDAKTSRTLVGYATGATNMLDRPFDAIAMGIKTKFELYSLAENKALCIQGRSLPFDQNDTIPMGVSIPQNGIYTIAIATVDGLFTNSNQNIFLEDQLLGIVHNLRTAPYSFTANTGTFENRFVLRYTSSALGTDNFALNHTVKVVTNEKVTVHTANQIIKEILVFDLLGRKINSYKNINAAQFTLSHLSKTMTTLILKITLENDTVVTEKIIF